MVRLGADIAIYLVTARVSHGFLFGELAAIFALANGGMIGRDLLDAAVANAIEAAIADMADCYATAFHHCERENASHTAPLRMFLSIFVYKIVRVGNALADALFGVPARIFEAGRDCFDSGLCSFFPSFFSAHSIDNKKQAFFGVDVIQILIVGTMLTGISRDACDQLRCAGCWHGL